MKARSGEVGAEAFADLVDCAYQAAINGEAWPTFLTRFADGLHGNNTALLVNDLASKHHQAIACVRTDPEQLRLHNEYYCCLNPWMAKGTSDLALGRVPVGVGEMYFPGHELLRTEFYDGWLRPQKLKHRIAAVIVAGKNLP